jgi:hypothetical protein
MSIEQNAPTPTGPIPAGKMVSPGEHYDSPSEVVQDGSLSKTQKTKALDSWEHDAHRLQTADDEGMSGGEPDRLIEVVEAKKKIGAETITTQHK